MFANTGTVSFVLYGIFIAITVIALFVAFYIILKGKVDTAKLDKMIELFKYAIVSVAIATITLVVSDMFKEREQDVKELEYFDRYVDDVEKVDGIEQRFQLSKYLSIVAPSGELKQSWSSYHDTIKIEYAEYLRDKKEKAKLDTITNPTKEQETRKEQLSEKIEKKEAPLVPTVQASAPALTPRVYIQIAEETQRPVAATLQSVLRNENFNAPGIENVGRNPRTLIPTATEVRYYREEELDQALRLITLLKSMKLGLKINDTPQKVSGAGRGTRPGHYEIWFSRS